MCVFLNLCEGNVCCRQVLAGVQGFEPRFPDPESGVMPLYDTPLPYPNPRLPYPEHGAFRVLKPIGEELMQMEGEPHLFKRFGMGLI